jgi:hypothetical protein
VSNLVTAETERGQFLSRPRQWLATGAFLKTRNLGRSNRHDKDSAQRTCASDVKWIAIYKAQNQAFRTDRDPFASCCDEFEAGAASAVPIGPCRADISVSAKKNWQTRKPTRIEPREPAKGRR